MAGAFDPERGSAFGTEPGVASRRCYPDHLAMLEAKAERADGIQAVSVATPNNTHFAIAKVIVLGFRGSPALCVLFAHPRAG